MTDGAGQVVWRAAVQPFGRGSASPSTPALRFAGEPQSAGTGPEGGLYHLGARSFDPLTGQFLTPDPIQLSAVK